MSRQLAFLVDTSRCVRCNSCRVACQLENDTGPAVNWRQVTSHLKGTFPNLSEHGLSLACNHCAAPACIKVCPVDAISKNDADGVVILDTGVCNGCGRCVAACPYGAPRKIPNQSKVSKCHFCAPRRARGLPPKCVETCIGGALHYGFVDEMKKMAPGRPLERSVDGFVDPSLTNPSTRFLSPGAPGPVAPHIPPLPAPSRRTDRHTWAYGLAALVLAAIAGGVDLLARREKRQPNDDS